MLLVARGDEVIFHDAFGQRSLEPARTPMTRDIVFDLSSLTKPLVTTTAVMLLVREGKMRLDDRVTRFIPNFGVHGKTHVDVRHLLSHCSGLPAWRPFFKDVRAGRAARGRRDFSRVAGHPHDGLRGDPPRAAPSTPREPRPSTAISGSSSWAS